MVVGYSAILGLYSISGNIICRSGYIQNKSKILGIEFEFINHTHETHNFNHCRHSVTGQQF